MNELEKSDICALMSYYEGKDVSYDEKNIEPLGGKVQRDLWSEVIRAVEAGDEREITNCLVKVERSDISFAGKQWLLMLLNISAPIVEARKFLTINVTNNYGDLDGKVIYYSQKILELMIEEATRIQKEEYDRVETALMEADAELSYWKDKKNSAARALELHRTRNEN